MNATLTVILPVHNAETELRSSVLELLDVAADLTPRFELLVFDDGSTDDTYDVAAELAAEFPQVRIGRHSRRRGLGAALRNARRRATGELVVVHDGVSRINAEQLSAVWRSQMISRDTSEATIDDLRLPGRAQAAMEAAHSRLAGFRVADEPVDTPPQPQMTKPRKPVRRPSGLGIGSIPVLPRPNFLGALADFARGE